MPTVDMIATGRNIKDIMKGKGMTAKDINTNLYADISLIGKAAVC